MSAPDGIRFKSNDMRHMPLDKLLAKAVNDYIRAIEHICEHDALEKCSSILERHGWVRRDVNIDQLKDENAKLRELLSVMAYCNQFRRDCDGCSMNGAAGIITERAGCDELLARLRELGVEVDG